MKKFLLLLIVPLLSLGQIEIKVDTSTAKQLSTTYFYTQKFGKPVLDETRPLIYRENEYHLNGKLKSTTTYDQDGLVKYFSEFDNDEKKISKSGHRLGFVKEEQSNELEEWTNYFFTRFDEKWRIKTRQKKIDTLLICYEKYFYSPKKGYSYSRNNDTKKEVYRQRIIKKYNEKKMLVEETFLPKKLLTTISEKGSFTEDDLYFSFADEREQLKKYNEISSNPVELEKKIINDYDDFWNLITKNTYNSEGKLIGKLIFRYDENKNLVDEIGYNSNGQIESRTVRKFDENNNRIEKIIYGKNESLQSKEIYRYDKNNYNYETIKYSHFCDGELILSSYKLKRKGADGLINKSISYFDDTDCDGNLPGMCGYKPYSGARYKYNEEGNLVLVTEYNLITEKNKIPSLGKISSKHFINGEYDKDIDITNCWELCKIDRGDYKWETTEGVILSEKSVKKTGNTFFEKDYGHDIWEMGIRDCSIEKTTLDDNGKILEKNFGYFELEDDEGCPDSIKIQTKEIYEYEQNEVIISTYMVKENFGLLEEILTSREIIEEVESFSSISSKENLEKINQKQNLIFKTYPVFPGCIPSESLNSLERNQEDRLCLNKGISKHIKRNLKYPIIAEEMGIQEKIMVGFVINKEGNITDVVVVKGEDKHLRNEAIRLVKGLPKMLPAKQDGKPISVKFTVPIIFEL